MRDFFLITLDVFFLQAGGSHFVTDSLEREST